jgi:hypothetical protein
MLNAYSLLTPLPPGAQAFSMGSVPTFVAEPTNIPIVALLLIRQFAH